MLQTRGDLPLIPRSCNPLGLTPQTDLNIPLTEIKLKTWTINKTKQRPHRWTFKYSVIKWKWSVTDTLGQIICVHIRICIYLNWIIRRSKPWQLLRELSVYSFKTAENLTNEPTHFSLLWWWMLNRLIMLNSITSTALYLTHEFISLLVITIKTWMRAGDNLLPAFCHQG